MSSTAGTMAGASSCVTLAGHIIELLMTSKGNKEEFRSLLVAVQGIYSFLKELPEDGITPQGTIVLRQLHANLLPAKRLLSEVARMGPLMSLIKANVVRDEFLRINRDITSTFSLLAAGEQLLDLARSRSQQMKDAEQIRRQLLSCDSDFFADEAAALGRLQDVAAAGQQGGWSEQKLQRRLLDQLQPEVACMQPDELLAEFKALQMLVMYNGAGGGVQQQGDSKGKKDVDAQTEEFLVQQVCAALAATVASTTAGPLQPEAAASPPADFLCPISQQLMVDPAVLVETGHSYEAANICRWLDTHGTCPITRQQLHSKQLVPNISLRKAIADWAASHGRIMPPAPVYKSLHSDTCGDSGGGAPCVSDAAAAVDQYQERRSSGFTAAAAANGTGVSAATGSQDPFIVSMAGAAGHRGAGRNFGHRGAGRNSSKSAFQCSRTRWAVGIVALLLVAGGIAAGVGIFFTVRRNKQASTPSSGVPVPASMGGLETKGNSDSNNTSTGQGALGGQCAPLGKCNIPLIEGGCECDANCACRPGRGADNCDKCNIWAREGGCKCDDKCDCRPGLGADKCDKCRMQYSDGGCPGASGPRCDVNCDCL